MVKHILKDGTVITDITGHVVKASDEVNSVYTLMDKISNSKTKENKHEIK